MDKKPKRMVPEVRFKGFTDDWEQRKFKNSVSRITKHDNNSDLPHIEYENINSGMGSLKNRISELHTEKDGVVFQKNDILFGKLRPYLKNWYFANFDGIAVGDFWILRSDNIYPKFVYYLIQTEKFFSISNLSSGSKMPRSDWNLVSNYKFQFPQKIQESMNIGQLLSVLDKLLSLQQRKLEQLKQLKKAMLQRLLVSKKGKLISNIRFKDFTETWEQRKFGDIANRESKQIESTSDIPSVEYDDIVSNQGNLNKDISTKKAKKKGIEFNDTNVLYGKLRPYLHNWLNASFTGVAVGDWWVLKPVKIRKNFLYYLIQTKKYDNVANLSSGSKMPRSDWNLVSNTAFSIPNTEEEQEKIGIFLSDLESLITLHQRKLNQLSKIKKFCLQKMFI
ncbi:restriction endonuclease subunit S [Limosilactobacillus vaginalis]|uniref:restriction endonuclease subunit S n=1 Tax=Limosilactobacillus vaginalis TaxID=1633 RepID=UPI00241F9BA9|nr:restriction endonuclease subunit S [Limosilactobacillus vaginalis]